MKKYLVSGLAFLLPIAITAAIIKFVIEFLTQPFQNLFGKFLEAIGMSEQLLLINTSSLIILLFLFLFTILTGAFVRWFILHHLIRYGEKIVAYIPLVGTIYKASKEVIHTLIASPQPSFSRVVMVPFPNEKSYGLGLLVKENPVHQIGEGDFLSVFIPTTPNPTTGFLLMFPKHQVRATDISVEDALKYIISCGMISPETPGASPSSLKGPDTPISLSDL